MSYPDTFTALTRTTDPATEPVTVAEVQSMLNLTGDDALIETLITAARQKAEHYLNRALITQSWTMFVEHIPYGEGLLIPYPNLQSVSAFSYYDADSTENVAVVADTLDIDTDSQPGIVRPKYGTTLPIAGRDWKRYKLVYSAGYGSAADDVPQDIRTAITRMAAWMYENRGTCPDVTGVDAVSGSNSGGLLNPHIDRTLWA